MSRASPSSLQLADRTRGKLYRTKRRERILKGDEVRHRLLRMDNETGFEAPSPMDRIRLVVHCLRLLSGDFVSLKIWHGISLSCNFRLARIRACRSGDSLVGAPWQLSHFIVFPIAKNNLLPEMIRVGGQFFCSMNFGTMATTSLSYLSSQG